MVDVPKDPEVVLTPHAREQMERLVAEAKDPAKARSAITELFANIRQAHHAWQSGQYDSFPDAMEAITGQRPQRVDEDEIERRLQLACERCTKLLTRATEGDAELVIAALCMMLSDQLEQLAPILHATVAHGIALQLLDDLRARLVAKLEEAPRQ